MPKTAFCGHWPDAEDVCTGKLVGPSYEGRFVAEAKFDGESGTTLLTSSSLMLSGTHVVWRKPHMDAIALLRSKCDVDKKHRHAMFRAREMYTHLMSSGIDLGGRIVLTLDGMGTNRVSGDEVLESLPPSQRPETLTLEMNPDVALAQRIALGFGGKVRFTGGDPVLSYRSPRLKTSGPPTIESVIVSSHNRVLSDDEKRRVVWLNLDYCGGPPKNHSIDECAIFMRKCLAHLPHVHMVSVTMARRNHANLDDTFSDYFPTPYGFELQTTYTSNGRVVCNMYTRNSRITRHLSIPGHWWHDIRPSWRRTHFDGVVVGRQRNNMFTVYVPFDDLEYDMRADAIAAYAAD